MSRKKGFTLIELLVVISIIALLLSILMPSLSKAKESAKRIVCQSNLKQWGLCFSMYTNHYNGSFGESWLIPVINGYGGLTWPNELEPYYQGSEKLLVCPSATKGHPNPQQDRDYMGARSRAWTWPWQWDYSTVMEPGDIASYGRNGWVANPRSEYETLYGNSNIQTRYNYRKAGAKGAANIPLLLDSVWVTVWSQSTHEPPPYEELYLEYSMAYFCLDRHGSGTINSLFLDSSTRRVGLKELWTLKWHRNFNTSDIYTKAGGMTSAQWPEWMQRFKEY